MSEVPTFSGIESEQENNVPTFFIHGLTENLQLWVSVTGKFMDEIEGKMKLLEDFEAPVLLEDSIRIEKRVARHKLSL